MMGETLRPRSLGELFSQTFSLVFGNLPALAGIQLIFWLPVSVLSFLISTALKDVSVQVDPSGGVSLDEDVLVGGTELLFNLVAGLVVHPIMSAASMLVIADRFTGRRTSVGGAIRIALRRFGSLIMVGFVVNLCAGACLSFGVFVLLAATATGGLGAIVGLVAAIACILLFFWVQITFSVAAPAVALENLGTGAALQRSRYLTAGLRARILLLMVTIGIILIGLGAAIGLAELTPALDREQEMARWGVETVSSIVYSMVVCVAIVAVYFDLRVRKDGFDLDNLAELVDVIARRAAIPRERAADSVSSRDLEARDRDEHPGSDT